ncbi:MAG: NAD(P)/FAD-dependent oxidoreductase, partial [Thermoplasmata archaeon]
PKARDPEVVLVTGALPFLAGLPQGLITRARAQLKDAGVAIISGYNVVRVEPKRLELEDGTQLPFDAAVWCAGLQSPSLVRALSVPHGHGGRIATTPALEIPGYPGCFGAGDVIELRDPVSKALVPGTAQAAIMEARASATNLLARWNGKPRVPFRYRERGTIVAVGRGRGAGVVGRLTLWGNSAAYLKRIVQREYSEAVERGSTPRGL